LEYFVVDLCDNHPLAAHEASGAQHLRRTAPQLAADQHCADPRFNDFAPAAALALAHVSRLPCWNAARALRWRRFGFGDDV
jgi:hypothetical protein